MTPYYQDAAVTLFHADCREVLPTLAQVDHVITDPPYARDVYIRALGNNTKKGSKAPDRLYKGASMAKLAAGDIGCIDEMLDEVAVHIARLTSRWAVVFSDAESTFRWREALTATKFECDCDGGDQGDGLCSIPHERQCASLKHRPSMRYIRTGAWVKPDPMPQMTGDRPCVGFEPCTIAHAQGPMRWNGGGHAAVWTHFTAKGSTRPDHPCPKPEKLMLELVQQFTDPNDLILDPYAGSGTTLFAAKRLGRRAIGCEIDERYAEVTAKRLQQSALDLWGAGTTPDAVDPGEDSNTGTRATRGSDVVPGELFTDGAASATQTKTR